MRKKLGIPVNEVFFSSDPSDAPTTSPVYFFVQAARPGPGLSPFKTQIIDLTQPSSKLFSQLSSNTRYKIRRAERDGIVPSIASQPSEADIADFCTFFDTFASHKGLPRSNSRKLLALLNQRALILSSATCETTSKPLVMHAYVCDAEIKRARLLYSASHFRAATSSEDTNRIGRANRLLHWYEMEQFRKLGYTTYDLGGVPIDQRDPAKNAIARFKSEFGGHHVIEFNGFQSRIPLIQQCLGLLRRWHR